MTNNTGKYNLVRKDYRAISGWYDSTYDASKEMAPELNDFMSGINGPTQKVLDAGAGPGKESSFLSKICDVTAFDISPEMISIIKQNFPDIKTVLGDINHLPFDNETFDGIWTCRTIIHIPIEDLGNVFKEFNRVLKEGGYLAIVSINTIEEQDHMEQFLTEEDSVDPKGQLIYYRNLYSSNLLIDFLERANFEIIMNTNRSDTREPIIYIKAQKK